MCRRIPAYGDTTDESYSPTETRTGMLPLQLLISRSTSSILFFKGILKSILYFFKKIILYSV